jgi:hypothetical protein
MAISNAIDHISVKSERWPRVLGSSFGLAVPDREERPPDRHARSGD